MKKEVNKLDEIKKIIVNIVDVSEEEISLESNLSNDLGLESLEFFDLIEAIEEKYGVVIPDKEVKNLQTVQDLITYVEKDV